MAVISGSLPNIIGGVSQQPPEIRAPNTATALTNTWSSVISGLSTRVNSKFIADIGAVPVGEPKPSTHGISKSTGRYKLSVVNGAITVTNLNTGATEPVTVLNGADAYLATADASRDIRFSTIADTTFILNRSVTTQVIQVGESGATGLTEDGTVRLNPNLYSTVWVKQSTGYQSYYTIYRNNAQIANVLINDNATAISNALRSTSGSGNLTGNGITWAAITDTITSLENAAETDYHVVSDNFGGQAMACYDDAVEEFADLTDKDRDGRLVLVKQDQSDTGDDYWVWFKGGEWQETFGWGAYEYPDKTTLPVVLIDNLDGTWTLDYRDYPGRTVGDADSNPAPSFLGQKISDMFRYKGRLVLLSGENIIMSRKGELENFYRTVCTQLIDEDRIDIAASESRGADLLYARPFNKGLLAFSATDQFLLTGDNDGLVSPNTVDMDLVNTYLAHPGCDPVGVGPNILFADSSPSGGYTRIREYQIERIFGNQVALPITDHIPEYIPGGIYRMLSVPSASAVIVATHGDPNALYAYNYYYNNDGKVQSSWQRWEFADPIVNVVLMGNSLILTSYRDGRVIDHSIDFVEGVRGDVGDEDILLDYRVHSSDLVVTFDGTDTSVALPYPAGSDLILVTTTDNAGNIAPGTTVMPDQVDTVADKLVFAGTDLTGEAFYVGAPYTFEWEPSPIFLRDEKQVAILDGRLQLQSVKLSFSQCGPFSVTVTPPGRSSYTKELTALATNGGGSMMEAAADKEGTFRFAAPGEAPRVRSVVTASTPWRARFSSLEWGGRYQPKRRRT